MKIHSFSALCLCLLFGFSAGFCLFAQEAQIEGAQPSQHLVPVQPVFVPAQTPAQTQQPEQTQQNVQTPPAQQPPAQTPLPAAPQTPSQTTAPPAQRRTGSDALQNYRIGRDLEARNRFDEANTYYNEAVRICMDELNRNNANMDSYTVLTWTLLRQRRYAEVINWGDRALRINTGDFRIVETMGEAYFYLNDYEHALIMLQRYTASMPRGDRASTAYFFMGEIYRNQRKYLHADIAYTTAVALEGSIFLWWYRLGMVREAAGEYGSAVEAYEKSLGLNSSSRETTEALERARRLNAAASR